MPEQNSLHTPDFFISRNPSIEQIETHLDKYEKQIGHQQKIRQDGSKNIYLHTKQGRSWRKKTDKYIEEGWITIHPNKKVTTSTLWNETDEYRESFLKLLEPENRGYHRCATHGKYHEKDTQQDGKVSTRWAKNIDIDNWEHEIEHYILCMLAAE